MSLTYDDLPNSDYPDSLDAFENKIDADADAQPLITQYKTLVDAGNISAANDILVANPRLKKMSHCANDINRLQDAIMACQRFFKRLQQQTLISPNEPSGSTVQSNGDIWIQRANGRNIGKYKVKNSDGIYEQIYLEASIDFPHVTIPPSGWSATAPYTQTVAVQGMVDTMEPICDIVLSGTAADAAALEAYACVSRIASGANSITATCLEDKPGAAINLKFKVVR